MGIEPMISPLLGERGADCAMAPSSCSAILPGHQKLRVSSYMVTLINKLID